MVNKLKYLEILKYLPQMKKANINYVDVDNYDSVCNSGLSGSSRSTSGSSSRSSNWSERESNTEEFKGDRDTNEELEQVDSVHPSELVVNEMLVGVAT